MPNRIIKESIHSSDSVARMSDFQFRLWVNLITYVDDFGRGDARPAIIKGVCFPLRDRVTVKDIDAALHALADIGCVCLYTVDGKPYLSLPSWGKHQQIRNKRSRFPAPPEELISIAINCVSESESESESISESESESESAWARVCREDKELGEALKAFATMRQRMRKPLTDRAKGMLITELQKYPRHQWVALVDQSIKKGWTSIYPLKGEETKPETSYDLEKAAEKMRYEVPKLRKKEDRG